MTRNPTTFTIAASKHTHPDGLATVTGYTYGLLAIHPPLNAHPCDLSYKVTHLPTGMAFMTLTKDHDAMQLFCERLGGEIDFDTTDPDEAARRIRAWASGGDGSTAHNELTRTKLQALADECGPDIDDGFDDEDDDDPEFDECDCCDNLRDIIDGLRSDLRAARKQIATLEGYIAELKGSQP